MFFCFFGFVENIVSRYGDSPLGSGKTPCHNIEGCAFSGAVRPQKSIYLSGFNSKTDMIYRKVVVIFLYKVLYFYQIMFTSLSIINFYGVRVDTSRGFYTVYIRT